MDTRLDLAPLRLRAGGPRWRQFRRDAIAGVHGQDLADRRMLFNPGPWRRNARMRFQLTEFARVNGLTYQHEPGLGRIGAHIFGSPTQYRHLDRVEVPGQRGFAVANYERTSNPDESDDSGFHAGYVVFRLRESYPHTLASHHVRNTPRALRGVEPVAGPDGFKVRSTKPDYALLRRLLSSGVVDRARQIRANEIEVVADQLFVLNGGFRSLRNPRTWQRLESIADALAPFLRAPAPTASGVPAGPLLPTVERPTAE